jgi:hypothetical protein
MRTRFVLLYCLPAAASDDELEALDEVAQVCDGDRWALEETVLPGLTRLRKGSYGRSRACPWSDA